MPYVLGIDSGGSTTRALALNLEGERVGYGESGGGNSTHDDASRENVREAIRRATESCGIENVVRVVAGIAGYNYPDQLPRVEEATAVERLRSVREHYNDTEIAHFGAFGGGPGIVTIQGTGSAILGILENGRRVKNGDFLHYARGGAVWIGINGLLQLLNGRGEGDPALKAAAFELWEVSSIDQLHEAVMNQKKLEVVERSHRHGMFARAITASASEGWPLAQRVCEDAVREIATGIRMLGSAFESEEVLVAPIGACIRSEPIRAGVERFLAEAPDKRYALIEPNHSPVVGAALMALRNEGVQLDADLRAKIGF